MSQFLREQGREGKYVMTLTTSLTYHDCLKLKLEGVVVFATGTGVCYRNLIFNSEKLYIIIVINILDLYYT